MSNLILNILTHEYVLAVYGVVAWQLEGFFRSNKSLSEYHRQAWREMGQSLIWVGIAVVFDDEILAQYNSWAEMDYHAPEPWMYTATGFFITIIRSKIAERIGLDQKKEESENSPAVGD